SRGGLAGGGWGGRGGSCPVFRALPRRGEGAGGPWARAGVGPPAGPNARPAKGKFLVSGHGLGDPNFAESVILLLAVDDKNGAMGVIVNRPTPIKLSAILPESKSLADRGDRVWRGGPGLPTSLPLLVRAKSPPDRPAPLF